MQWYASNPIHYKDQINQIIAEANGFNTKEEMKAWVSANLSDEYKKELMANVLSQVETIDEVQPTTENVVGQSVKRATTASFDGDMTTMVD